MLSKCLVAFDISYSNGDFESNVVNLRAMLCFDVQRIRDRNADDTDEHG